MPYSLPGMQSIWGLLLIHWGRETAKDATNYGSLFPWDGFSLQASWDALRKCSVLQSSSQRAPIPASWENPTAMWATHPRAHTQNDPWTDMKLILFDSEVIILKSMSLEC